MRDSTLQPRRAGSSAGAPTAAALAGAIWMSGVACSPQPFPGSVDHVEVTATAASEGWAVNYPKQRKMFWAAERLWLLYSDGAEAVVRTSADGRTFGEPAVVAADSVFGHRMATWFDGRYVHLAHCRAYASDDVTYRRGEPLADGTIAWSGPEQIAHDMPAGDDGMYPVVTADADGNPWVGWMQYTGDLHAGPWHAWVSRSARSDGTWETAPGFPYALVESNVTAYPQPMPVSLAGGGVVWIYNRELDATYRARPWRDGVWDAEEQVSSTPHGYGLFNAVADGDVVHVAFGDSGLFYRRRAADGTWGPELGLGRGSGHVVVTRLAPETVAVSFLDVGGGRLALSLVEDGDVRGPWALRSEPDGFADPGNAMNLNGLVAAAGPFDLGLAYTSGATAPYPLHLVTVAAGAATAP